MAAPVGFYQLLAIVIYRCTGSLTDDKAAENLDELALERGVSTLSEVLRGTALQILLPDLILLLKDLVRHSIILDGERLFEPVPPEVKLITVDGIIGTSTN